MIRQRFFPAETHFARWGCLNLGPGKALEVHSGKLLLDRWVIDLAIRAQVTPVTWNTEKMVISYDEKTGLWNNDFDWWCAELCRLIPGPPWEMYPVGQQLPDGTLRWYADEAWWIRQHPGMAGFKTYTFIENRYGRPAGGGHYIYEDVKRQEMWDPDPGLLQTGDYLIRPGAWLFYLGRKK